MWQFLIDLFLGPLIQTPDEFAGAVLALLGFACIFTWVATMIMARLAFNEKTDRLIDADTRINMSWSLSLLIVIFLFLGNAIYLWLRHSYGGSLLNIGPHIVVFMILFIVWILQYRAFSRNIRRLRALL
jgi:hypothetical protein